MMTDDETHFTFTHSIDVSPPFFAWVATFGRSIKIVSPEPVVKEMRKFLQNSMDMYKNDRAILTRQPVLMAKDAQNDTMKLSIIFETFALF